MTIGLNNLQQQTMESALAEEEMEKQSYGESSSAGSYSSWEDSDDESLLEEMGERLEEFSHVGSTPALAALVFNTDDYKLALPKRRFPNIPSDSSANSRSMLSEIFLSQEEEESLKSFQMRRSNSDQFVQQGSFTNLAINTKPTQNATYTNPQTTETNTRETKPFTLLKEILKQEGMSYPNTSGEATNDLLLEMKDENFAAYGREIADAARTGDIKGVRKHIAAGKTLQCCNKFKESIVHVVCRRGHEELLKIMLEETDVSVCIKDDIGRTPLHELCWTSVPNFSMVKMILERSPDLLYLEDNRNFTPLHYVGQNNWDAWCEFLEANRELVTPRTL